MIWPMRILIKIQKLILRIDKIYVVIGEHRSDQTSKIYAEIWCPYCTHSAGHFIIITSQSHRMLNCSYYCLQGERLCVCVRLGIEHRAVAAMIEWYVMWYGGMWHMTQHVAFYVMMYRVYSELIIESDLKSKCGHNLVQPICCCCCEYQRNKKNLVRNILQCRSRCRCRCRIVVHIWHDPNSHRNILVDKHEHKHVCFRFLLYICNWIAFEWLFRGFPCFYLHEHTRTHTWKLSFLGIDELSFNDEDLLNGQLSHSLFSSLIHTRVRAHLFSLFFSLTMRSLSTENRAVAKYIDSFDRWRV